MKSKIIVNFTLLCFFFIYINYNYYCSMFKKVYLNDFLNKLCVIINWKRHWKWIYHWSKMSSLNTLILTDYDLEPKMSCWPLLQHISSVFVWLQHCLHLISGFFTLLLFNNFNLYQQSAIIHHIMIFDIQYLICIRIKLAFGVYLFYFKFFLSFF